MCVGDQRAGSTVVWAGVGPLICSMGLEWREVGILAQRVWVLHVNAVGWSGTGCSCNRCKYYEVLYSRLAWGCLLLL
jgi:hypothetical protein